MRNYKHTALAVLMASGCLQQQSGPKETPMDVVYKPLTTGTVVSDACKPYEAAASRYVAPTNGAGLISALQAAIPGDLIELAADTDYIESQDGQNNFLAASRNGTSGSRIVLCGPPSATLKPGTGGHGMLRLESSSYWTVTGFTIQGGKHGVEIKTGSNNQLLGLTINEPVNEGILLHVSATNNVVSGNTINDAGTGGASNGHGVRIGSTAGGDASTGNSVLGNAITNMRQAGVYLVSGSTGNTVEDNSINTSGNLHDPENPAAVVGTMLRIESTGNSLKRNTGTMIGRIAEGAVSAASGIKCSATGNTISDNVGKILSTGAPLDIVSGNTTSGNQLARYFSAAEEFSGTQGNASTSDTLQWSYQTRASGTYTNYSTYNPDVEVWETGDQTTVIGPQLMIPTDTVDAVRSFQAPAAGVAVIDGAITALGSVNTDVEVRYRDLDGSGNVLSDTVVFGPITLTSTDPTNAVEGVTVSMGAGDELKFIVKATGQAVNWDANVSLK